MILQGKTFFMLGLGGLTGRAAYDYLHSQGATVLGWDDDENCRAEFAEKMPLVRVADVAPETLDFILPTPGMHPMKYQSLVDGHVAVMSDIDLLQQRFPQATYVGITGTNGKSTTTALVAHILQKAGKDAVAGGNFGNAALSLPEAEIYVLELSSYQIDLLHSLKLDGAVLLNLTPDHLDRYGNDFGQYRASKERMFQFCKPSATQQSGLTSPFVYPEFLKPEDHATHLPGAHNQQNIAAAWVLCAPLGITQAQFKQGVNSFDGLPHRLQHIMTRDGVQFVNDSKATNGDAVVAALTSSQNIYWLIGGQKKADGLKPCLEKLDSVRAVFAYGQDGKTLLADLPDSLPKFLFEALDDATTAATHAARADMAEHGLANATVLLSPAAASWDQFASFEARGQAFVDVVKKIA